MFGLTFCPTGREKKGALGPATPCSPAMVVMVVVVMVVMVVAQGDGGGPVGLPPACPAGVLHGLVCYFQPPATVHGR